MEYKIGEIFKHKGKNIIVKEGIVCGNCFFDSENYPFKKDNYQICYRDKSIKCGSKSRKDKTNVIYKEISEIEYLILKGGDNT